MIAVLRQRARAPVPRGAAERLAALRISPLWSSSRCCAPPPPFMASEGCARRAGGLNTADWVRCTFSGARGGSVRARRRAPSGSTPPAQQGAESSQRFVRSFATRRFGRASSRRSARSSASWCSGLAPFLFRYTTQWSQLILLAVLVRVRLCTIKYLPLRVGPHLLRVNVVPFSTSCSPDSCSRPSPLASSFRA